MEQEIKDFEIRLGNTTDKLHEEFAGLRTNRPTTKLVEDIKVDYYGQMMPLKALGSIGINPPREITISLWDKNAREPVTKALESSGLGMTPNIDGNLIRLNLPTLTDERRQELVKLIKKTAEEAKIKIRLSRDDINKKIKETEDAGGINEGEKFKFKERVQAIVDRANQKTEELLAAKTKEVND